MTPTEVFKARLNSAMVAVRGKPAADMVEHSARLAILSDAMIELDEELPYDGPTAADFLRIISKINSDKSRWPRMCSHELTQNVEQCCECDLVVRVIESEPGAFPRALYNVFVGISLVCISTPWAVKVFRSVYVEALANLREFFAQDAELAAVCFVSAIFFGLAALVAFAVREWQVRNDV